MTDPTITAPASDPTPPKRPGPKELARSLNLDNIEQLAARIKIGGHSVSGRTLYKWFHRGAPFTSEAALVSWVGNQGLPIAPVQPSLGEVLDATMAQLAPTTPAEQGSGADEEKATTGLSAAAIKALASSRLTDRQTYKQDLEIGELEKVLVHRDKVLALVKALGLAVITGLTDLIPRTMRALPTDIADDHRPLVREILQAEVTRMRASLNEQTPTLLRQLFGEES